MKVIGKDLVLSVSPKLWEGKTLMDISKLSADQINHLFSKERSAALRPGLNVRFLLIQEGIVDCAPRPDTLAYAYIDDTSDFQVAIGCVNEHDEREIIGIVAEAHPVEGAKTWRVSSELDGCNRMVGIAGLMKDFVKKRLRVYWHKGRFSDLCQLPQPVLIRGEK